jgi:hypothetical protein
MKWLKELQNTEKKENLHVATDFNKGLDDSLFSAISEMGDNPINGLKVLVGTPQFRNAILDAMGLPTNIGNSELGNVAPEFVEQYTRIVDELDFDRVRNMLSDGLLAAMPDSTPEIFKTFLQSPMGKSKIDSFLNKSKGSITKLLGLIKQNSVTLPSPGLTLTLMGGRVVRSEGVAVPKAVSELLSVLKPFIPDGDIKIQPGVPVTIQLLQLITKIY